jgi:hypothetical protein
MHRFHGPGTTYGRIAVVGALAVLSSLGVAGTALAHHASDPNADPVTGCGQVVTASLTLTHNVGPCAPAAADGAAIKVDGQSGITINLAGNEVYGCDDPLAACNTGPTPPDAAYVTGEGPGILVNNSTSVVVTDSSSAKTKTKTGTVRDFDSGVVIHGGSNNTVSHLTVKDNIGTAATESSYGEGIGIYRSIGNTLVNNTVHHNGPYAGIGVYNFTPDGTNLLGAAASTDGNKVGQLSSTGTCRKGRGAAGSGNTVSDNYVPPNGTTYQDDGVRVEPGVTNTMVDCNVVTGSSLDGIAVFATATGTKVRNNNVQGNGSHPLLSQRKGDGIVVFQRANGCTVSGNNVTANAGNGIRVDAHTCTANSNSSTNNAFNIGQPGEPIEDPRGTAANAQNADSQYAYFDLKDGQPDKACGSTATNPVGGTRNYWGNLTANTYGTRNRALADGSYCIQ